MKALRLHKVGSIEDLKWEEVPDHIVGPEDVLVRIVAVSLNYRDYGFATGAYSLVRELPLTLGSDGAGIVEQVGPRVTEFKPGDRVISLLRQDWYGGKLDSQKAGRQLGGTVDGVFSEFALFDKRSVVSAPSAMMLQESATLSTAGLTAFRVLTQSGIVAGQRVLVQGSGGVSLFALQIASKMGFEVFATTGSVSNENLLRQLGAHHVINYKSNPKWEDEVMRMTNKRGVDLIIDVAGGVGVQQSLNAIAFHGEIAIVGFLNGTQSTIDLVSVIRKNVRLSGYTTGSKDDLQQFVRWLEVNPIKPVIADVFTNFPDAFRAFIKREKPGKFVVSLNH